MSAKLINEQDHSTFTNAFSKAARLPTEQDRKAALELSAADMRKELFQPKYQANAQRDTRRAGSGSGWANEVPIGPPPGIAIIDQLCNTLMPHEPLCMAQTLRSYWRKLGSPVSNSRRGLPKG